MGILMFALLVGMVVFVGAFLVATPWLMPAQECFAVTVPADARQDPTVRGYLRTYALATAAASVVGVVLAIVAAALGIPDNVVLFTVLYCAAVFLPLIISFGLMLHFRKKMMALKSECGWEAKVQRRVAVIDEDDVPRPISVAWSLLFLPLIAGCAWLMAANYDTMPARVTMQVNLNGSPATMVDKSPLVAAFPAIFMAFISIVMAVTLFAIGHSKRPVNPSAPVSSALAYGRYARAMSVGTLVMGLLLVGVLGYTMALNMLGVVSFFESMVVIVVVLATILIGVGVFSVVFGQNGARQMPEGVGGKPSADDDKYWKLGVFYFNRNDPSVWVPKRFGIGWTVNLARPGAWMFFGGLILLVAVLVWVTSAM